MTHIHSENRKNEMPVFINCIDPDETIALYTKIENILNRRTNPKWVRDEKIRALAFAPQRSGSNSRNTTIFYLFVQTYMSKSVVLS